MIDDGGKLSDTGRLKLFTWRLQIQFRNQIQRLHWWMNLTSRNMEGEYRKMSYSTWTFIQDIIFFVINYFFSFPENFKNILQCILYLRKDHKPAFDSFPLKIVNSNSPYVIYLFFIFIFILVKTLIPNLMMTIFSSMSLKGSRLILQLQYILLYLVKFQINTCY